VRRLTHACREELDAGCARSSRNRCPSCAMSRRRDLIGERVHLPDQQQPRQELLELYFRAAPHRARSPVREPAGSHDGGFPPRAVSAARGSSNDPHAHCIGHWRRHRGPGRGDGPAEGRHLRDGLRGPPHRCRRHRSVSHPGLQRRRCAPRPWRGQARPGRRVPHPWDHTTQRHRQAPRRDPHRPVAARRHDQPDHQAGRPVPGVTRAGEQPGRAHRTQQAPGRGRADRRRGPGSFRGR